MATLANLRVKFGADISEFTAATATMGRSMGGIASAAVGLAGSFGLGAIIKSSLDAAGALADLQAQSGLSAEFLSGMRQAASLAGTDVNLLNRSVINLQRAAVKANEGSKSLGAAFEKLGISTAQFVTLSPDEMIRRFADALRNVRNPAERLNLLTQIMGGRAAKLAPLFANGAAGLNRFIEEARQGNQVLSEDQVAAGDAASDAIDALQLSWKGLIETAAISLSPAIIQAVEFTGDLVRNLDKARAAIAPFLALGNFASGSFAALGSGQINSIGQGGLLSDVVSESLRILANEDSPSIVRRGQEPNEAEKRSVEILERINESQRELTGVMRRNGGAVAQ